MAYTKIAIEVKVVLSSISDKSPFSFHLNIAPGESINNAAKIYIKERFQIEEPIKMKILKVEHRGYITL